MQYAQEFSERPLVSLTSITLDFTANSGVIVYNDASTSSISALRSHNRAILDAAAAELSDEAAGGSDNADELTDERYDGTRFIVEELICGSITADSANIGGGGAGAGVFASLTLTSAASKIIPGATSLSLRNHADAADNLIITDAGRVTTTIQHTIGTNVITTFDGITHTGLGGLAFVIENNAGLGLALSATTPSQFAQLINFRGDSGATSNLIGLDVALSTAVASYTVANVVMIQLDAPALGSGSAITTFKAINIAANSRAITTLKAAIDIGNISGAVTTASGIQIGTVAGGTGNNYGILIGNVTGTGAFAIKTGTGPVSFGDSLTVVGKQSIGNQAVAANINLLISGAFGDTTGVSQHALFINGVFSSGATTEGNCIRVDPYTAVASYTMTTLRGLRIGNVTLGSGSAVTTQIGLSIADLSSGETNYAIQTGTGLVSFGDLVITPASTTSRAGLRIPHGSAPSSPVNGDFWTDTSGAYVRINGATKTFVFV